MTAAPLEVAAAPLGVAAAPLEVAAAPLEVEMTMKAPWSKTFSVLGSDPLVLELLWHLLGDSGHHPVQKVVNFPIPGTFRTFKAFFGLYFGLFFFSTKFVVRRP